MSNAVDSVWYGRSPLKYFLLPFSLIFLAAASLRRLLYRLGILRVRKSEVPVVVIGNISVGGSREAQGEGHQGGGGKPRLPGGSRSGATYGR